MIDANRLTVRMLIDRLNTRVQHCKCGDGWDGIGVDWQCAACVFDTALLKSARGKLSILIEPPE